MIVCVCHDLSEDKIREVIELKPHLRATEVHDELSCRIACGACLMSIDNLIIEIGEKMLVREPLYKEGNIVVIKFVNSEEIVTRVKEFDATLNYIVAQQPLQVQIIRGQDGQPGKALMPWLLLAPEGNPTIELNTIIGVIEAPKEVADAWTRETSGIVIPR
jgi:bacterioferritin-associated ferredoxin